MLAPNAKNNPNNFFISHAGRSPEGNDETAGDDKRAACENGEGWERSESDECNDLPDDKQCRDVKANYTSELHWGQVESESVTEEQRRAGEH